MDDLLGEFLTETNENLAELDRELVRLEQEPDHPGLIDGIFRLVHTVKGTCGFLGLPRLERVAHAGENVLGRIRDRELPVTPEAVSLILGSLDRIKAILAALEATEREPEGDDSDLLGRLEALASAAAPARLLAHGMPSEPAAAVVAGPVEEELDELERAFREAPGPAPAMAAPVEPAPAEAAAAGDARSEPLPDSPVTAQSIRVSVDLLEHLMTMVSELVLTRNQLLQMVRGHDDSAFKVPLQRLSHITSELQEGVMKTRMQPIGNAWAKLPRIVRDLGHELGKRIDLQMLGAETELDRQVLELVKDPLTHMVRNSADHGLERPAERLAAGKPESGRIVLDAFHEGGHIILKVQDDGRGIDVATVRRKIVEKGLAGEAEADGFSDQQVLQYIFKPGFSTARNVTSVSGRGVGMDVVRSNIEKIGGTIDLKNLPGRGTTFTIKIPLTLAIVSALIVECRGERFAIPQLSVVELVRIAAGTEQRIEAVNRTPVLRLRDALLPLIYLDNGLGLASADAPRGEEAFVVVVQVGNDRFGLVVDRVFDTEEIVVKPVAPLLRDIAVFSGNTILGDGSIIMILDPNGIAASVSAHASLESERQGRQRAAGPGSAETTAFLLFRAGDDEPKAVPLSLVARLEEIDAASIERANGRRVVQYRDHLMPLVALDGGGCRSEGRQPVLVFAEGERSMGLLVDEIVDIVEEALEVEMVSDAPGRIGSAVLAGKATGIVDVAHYLTQAFGDWFHRGEEQRAGAAAAGKRILLVDDSPFFRNLLTPLLEVAGYRVTAAGDATQALRLRDEGERFDVIVSDIEMPGMNGFAFAEQVRADERWQSTPIVALSAYASRRDFERGRSAGFSDYVRKMDRDALLASLSQTLKQEGAAA